MKCDFKNKIYILPDGRTMSEEMLKFRRQEQHYEALKQDYDSLPWWIKIFKNKPTWLDV